MNAECSCVMLTGKDEKQRTFLQEWLIILWSIFERFFKCDERKIWLWTHGNVGDLQQEGGHVSGGERLPDGRLHVCHQLAAEGLPGRHLEEEDHPLLAVGVVLRHAQAVRYLLEGLHCRACKRHNMTGGFFAARKSLHTPLHMPQKWEAFPGHFPPLLWPTLYNFIER